MDAREAGIPITKGSRAVVTIAILLLSSPALAQAPGDAPAPEGENLKLQTQIDARAIGDAPSPGDASPKGKACDSTIASKSIEDTTCALTWSAANVGPAMVWTSVNDGAGSWLDADLLDGHSSEEIFGAIAAEATARNATDEKLWRALEAEKWVRQALHNQLRAEIDGLKARFDTFEQAWRADLAAERAARIAGDTENARLIAVEKAEREAAEAELWKAIPGEVATQVAEKTAGLTSDVKQLQSDTSKLRRDLDDETAKRILGDNQLSKRVGAVEGRADAIEGFVNGGNYRGSTAALSGGASFGGNVGIGTANPTARLHALLDHGSTASSGVGAFVRVLGGGAYAGTVLQVDAGNQNDDAAYGLLTISNNDGTKLIVRGDGNVGVGTSSPTARLHVRGGDVRIDSQHEFQGGGFSGSYLRTSEPTFLFFSDATSGWEFRSAGNAGSTVLRIQPNGNVGIGTANPAAARLVVQGNAGIQGADDQGTRVIGMFPPQSTGAHGQVGTVSDHDLDLITNAAARVTVAARGNVGIGTATPDSALHVVSASPNQHSLHIEAPEKRRGSAAIRIDETWNSSDGSEFMGVFTRIVDKGSAPQSSLFRGDVNGATVFDVKASGNVGIGVSNPEARVHVETTDRSSGSSGSTIYFRNRADDRSFPNLHLSAGSTSPVAGLIGVGKGIPDGAIADGLVVKTGTAHPILFLTNGNHERARISPEGNVGIGTANPTTSLDVRRPSATAHDGTRMGETSNVVAAFRNSQPSYDAGQNTFLLLHGGASAEAYLGVVDRVALGSKAGDFVLGVRQGGADVIERVRVAHDTGNVGIGTASPTARLAVAGDIKASGVLTVNADVGAGDVAEPVIGEGLEAGDVVVNDGFDATGMARVAKSTTPYSPAVIGIVSTNPSLRLAGLATDVPLAVTGIVPVKVVGAVPANALLVTSDTPGRAMACPEPVKCVGAVVGKAMEAHEGAGEGVVRAMVGLG